MNWTTNPRLVLAVSIVGLGVMLGGYFYWSPLGLLQSAAALAAFALFLLVGGLMDDSKF